MGEPEGAGGGRGGRRHHGTAWRVCSITYIISPNSNLARDSTAHSGLTDRVPSQPSPPALPPQGHPRPWRQWRRQRHITGVTAVTCPIADYHYDAHNKARPVHDTRVPGHIHAFSLQPMRPQPRLTRLQPQQWVAAALYSPLPRSSPLPCIPGPDPCILASHGTCCPPSTCCPPAVTCHPPSSCPRRRPSHR